MKTCSVCGRRVEKGTRCTDHPAARSPYGGAYPRQRRALLALGLPCWICGEPPWEDSINPHTGRYDPMTADHVEEVAVSGGFGELRPAHKSCNGRRGQQAQERAVARGG